MFSKDDKSGFGKVSAKRTIRIYCDCVILICGYLSDYQFLLPRMRHVSTGMDPKGSHDSSAPDQ